MLGDIKRTQSARKTLQYSEQKVKVEKAVLLYAENYLKEANQLTLREKLDRLQDRIVLNEIAESKVAHIVLTFHPEDRISNDTMVHLARRYMQAAGFEDQPYLVYRHFDAGNPHLHLVSTTVQSDTKIVDTGPAVLQRLKSLTQDMEQEFSLKVNRSLTLEEEKQLKVTHAQQIVYGEPSLKRAISDVLNTVIDHYKFTTTGELNAVLREYNVKADRGKEGTRLYQNRGLVYGVLDENGQRISRGIKASSFSLKPTLNYLEQKFAINEGLREYSRQRVETAIEWTFAFKKPDWVGFQQALGREGINVVVLENKEKKPADLYFVDHRELASFSGEGLGPQYTLRAIQEKCVQQQQLQEEQTQRHRLRIHL